MSTTRTPMRLAANENVPVQAVERLRSLGHDVWWAAESASGLKDPIVLADAQVAGRVLVTFDKDFGELVFRRGKRASCGVVLFRVSTRNPDAAADIICRELAAHAERVQGHFVVVEEWRTPVVALPESAR